MGSVGPTQLIVAVGGWGMMGLVDVNIVVLKHNFTNERRLEIDEVSEMWNGISGRISSARRI